MESLIKVKPDLSKLHIFSCGAYVFLPEEVGANKLTPRSELMTYIGYETGVKGWHFMRALHSPTCIHGVYVDYMEFTGSLHRL